MGLAEEALTIVVLWAVCFLLSLYSSVFALGSLFLASLFLAFAEQIGDELLLTGGMMFQLPLCFLLSMSADATLFHAVLMYAVKLFSRSRQTKRLVSGIILADAIYAFCVLLPYSLMKGISAFLLLFLLASA